MSDQFFIPLIKQRLAERDSNCNLISATVIKDYNNLLNRFVSLLQQFENIYYENTKIRSTNTVSSVSDETVKKKVYDLQEELTKTVKDKSGLDIQILQLKLNINEKEKEINEMKQTIQGLREQIAKQEALNVSYGNSIKKMEDVNRTLNDEISANSLAYQALNYKCQELEDNNFTLKDIIQKLQKNLDEKKNEEYDRQYRAQQEVITRGLREAANTPVEISLRGPSISISGLPNRVLQSISAHDGEMGCVRFSHSGKLLATSGADRRIKLWSNNFDDCELNATLTGCNGSVIGVDFDSTDSLILGCSTLDSSCRIWSTTDYRMRLCLTGHTNKVNAGRFFGGDGSRIVTGSADRTLKLWDTRSRQCIKTMLAMSAIHDVVVINGAGSGSGIIVSGHFDKNLRLWDSRGDLNTDKLILSGRIAGLDISPDQNSLIACTKDDAVQLIELRMMQVAQTYTNSQFKVGMELVRPCFSPDGQYVAVGGSDGSIYIWHGRTGRLERTLKGNGSVLIGVHWGNGPNKLAACERNKKVVIWGE